MPFLSTLPEGETELSSHFREGLVLEPGKPRKRPDKSDPVIVLERPGIYRIPFGKKGPDLYGMQEIDIASYPIWLERALDRMQWYLVLSPKEVIKFADRLNSNA